MEGSNWLASAKRPRVADQGEMCIMLMQIMRLMDVDVDGDGDVVDAESWDMCWWVVGSMIPVSMSVRGKGSCILISTS